MLASIKFPGLQEEEEDKRSERAKRKETSKDARLEFDRLRRI